MAARKTRTPQVPDYRSRAISRAVNIDFGILWFPPTSPVPVDDSRYTGLDGASRWDIAYWEGRQARNEPPTGIVVIESLSIVSP